MFSYTFNTINSHLYGFRLRSTEAESIIMQFTVFDGLTELHVSAHPLPATQTILAVSSLDRHLFLVTDAHDLYAGYVEIGATSVDIHRIRSAVVDVQCCAYDARLYVVGTLGTVHHLAIHRDNCRVAEEDAWKEVSIVNPRPCPHGVASSSETVPMVAVTGNVCGVIFSSVHGELFGMGRFGGVLPAQDTDRPVAFECFRGLRVLQVVAGEHQVLVLTSGGSGVDPAAGVNKRSSAVASVATSDTSSNDQSDDENVYVARDCARCVPLGGQQTNVTSATETAAAETNTTCTNTTTTTTTTTDTSMASSGSERSDVFDDDGEPGDSSWTPESARVQSKSIGDTLRTDKLKNFLMDTLSMGGGGGNGGTNLTSLVRDGVRNLSRHMSGSDSNDPDETIVAAPPTGNAANNTDPDGSSTTDDGEQQSISLSIPADQSDDDGDVDGDGDIEGDHDDDRNTSAGIMCGKIANLSELGERTLATSVWSFGTVRANNGVRTHISQVLGLSGQGVQAIACGSEHSVALTLDGRLYLWGSNREQQIDADNEVAAVKHPQRYGGASAAQTSVLAAACTRNSTEVLLNGLQMAVMMRQTAVATSRYRKGKEPTEPRDLLLGSMDFVVQNASRPARKHIEMHFTA